MRTGSNTHFQWYLQGILHPIVSNFLTTMSFSPFFFPWPTAGTSSCRRCSLPYILICLAEQLWVGQAIDTCLYTVTYEAFAPCSQLVVFLRSSNSTLCSTHAPRRVHSVPTRMSLQFMKDESSGAYYQERYHGQPPTPPPPPPKPPHAISSVATCMSFETPQRTWSDISMSQVHH